MNELGTSCYCPSPWTLPGSKPANKISPAFANNIRTRNIFNCCMLKLRACLKNVEALALKHLAGRPVFFFAGGNTRFADKPPCFIE
jgi:hypothetical protein